MEIIWRDDTLYTAAADKHAARRESHDDLWRALHDQRCRQNTSRAHCWTRLSNLIVLALVSVAGDY
ncbi:MAG: hypothetical protein H7123_01165 [Thermoleophilia bacterium]|nr:hypothetical protein [Thermoleophilia bacterium]